MDTSYLSQQVTTIIERLHGFFDEIGVASHERDSRESELFSALSETLHNQLNLVAKEKHDLTEEAKRLIKTIRQMERSLDDTKPDDEYAAERDGLKVTLPLLPCIQGLREKHHFVSKLHRERYEEVKKLVDALQSYASHLEPSAITLKLPPGSSDSKVPLNFDLSATYVGKLDNEFTRIYQEYNKRLALVSQLAAEIINLWSELGTPQAQVDSSIVQYAQDAPEQLGLHQEDIARLQGKREKLLKEKQQREQRLNELRASVQSLWERLGVEEAERKQFLAANRGCGLRQINEFEDQLSHLNELKRQNLHLFVEDARFKLQELWDGLYLSEEEMLEFTPAFSDVYSDALLSAHEKEIQRLETLKEQRAPILAAIDKHKSLIQDRENLEKSSLDASRLLSKGQKSGEKRDPGKLLREEKMRKRITKDLPKVEAELRKTLESWEDEYGRPFLVHGERYLDEIDAVQSKAPPPRSKTPNALSTTREAPKSVSRSQAQSRAGTMRGAPPPRSKTPTATIGRAAMASATTLSGFAPTARSANATLKLSPSKIPGASRLPMSAMRDGNNSPERRPRPAYHVQSKKSEDLDGTLRPVRPGMAAAPPKMKDLFVPPTPTPTGNKENNSEFERGASIVRPIEPDDPYDDRARHYASNYQTLQNSHMGPPPRPIHPQTQSTHDNWLSSSSSSQSHAGRPLSRCEYPVAPPSRQASNNSSIMSGSHMGSTVAGSENWESYTDNSETEEADATDAYYARVKAQQMQQQMSSSSTAGYKRPGTAGGYLGASKRCRDDAEQGGMSAQDDGLGDTF